MRVPLDVLLGCLRVGHGARSLWKRARRYSVAPSVTSGGVTQSPSAQACGIAYRESPRRGIQRSGSAAISLNVRRRQRPSTGHRRHTILAAAILASLEAVAGASGGNSNSPGHQPPTNSSLPTIAGTPAVGQTLSGNAGGWTGPKISYAYQWLRCNSSGGSCSAIGGATGTSYAVVTGDVGAT